ncbi:MAG: ribonuclease III [Oscillospiraceae bacterium]|nr:ribonuclease III [Oscillospiraceae bacterium]
MDRSELSALGVLNLAHVGDGVYELLVRTHLARQGACRLADQHRRTIAFVAAPAQAAALECLLPGLTEEERAVVRRGRNARVHGCPSGCTPAQYHAATALETLFGWLWLSGRPERIEELFGQILEETENAT